MIFGEFEWLMERHIEHQINVNLLGTMRVTKSFCPLLRKYKGMCANSVVKLLEENPFTFDRHMLHVINMIVSSHSLQYL
jgi:short-subunit dehydrogenase